jgi:beta-1,4-mannooligosaccharide/beta-1,4-mannosyl-N-acetylglucosamine phosphorylase
MSLVDRASSFVVGPAVPNVPWQERPAGSSAPMWRDPRNPIIPRDLFPEANSIFNSAAVPFRGKFAGVFRCDSTTRLQQLHAGFSDDGVNWRLNPQRITWENAPSTDPSVTKFQYAYDPRVVWIEDRYYVTWCNGYHGPTIGVGYTYDFETFHQLENALLPYNRNGVLFPRKINGAYVMLSRPSDNGHTPFGDIFISQSPDMVHWGRHRWVMGRGASGWEGTKIGAGPIPIETKEGWLIIYHGVLTSCNGFVYSFGAALLDLYEPWKVIARAKPYLIAPREPYELAGDVPNVCFPCAAIVDSATNRLAVYYGCADTTTGLCYGYVDELVHWVKTNAHLPRG